MFNKSNTNRSNMKQIRRVQTEADEPPNIQRGVKNQSKQKMPIPYKKIQISDTSTRVRKTFKINTYKQYQNKIMKTEPNERPGRITSLSIDKSKTTETKYKIDGFAGKGTFGVVYFGHTRGNGDKIAIKKVFQDKRYKNRQLTILKMIKNPFLLEMRDHFLTYEGDQEYLNVVMDFYPKNLFQVIQKKQLPTSLIKIFLFQLLRGLNYLTTLSIAHRDIKPQNVLVNLSTNKVVICDFGSAKQLIQGQTNLAYICSRCYRAPELIFGATDYTPQIDMWSLGCIVVEMVNGSPPFLGDSQVDQLIEIIKVLGTPTKQQIRDMNKNYDMKEYKKIPSLKPNDWKSLLRTQNAKLIDLVTKMLTYSPIRRLTPAEAMMHPFFDDLRSEEGFRELSSRYKSIPQLFSFTEEERSNFNRENPIPKWVQRQKESGELYHKINSISVKRPLHKLV